MAESSIEFPPDPESPGELATDLIGGVHTPYGKLTDGRPDGTLPLAVRADGSVGTAGRFTSALGLFTAGSTSYTEGQVVGDAMKIADMPGGIWRLQNLAMIAAAAGFSGPAADGLPPLHLILVSLADGGSAAALPGDGDTLAGYPISLVGTTTTFAAADLAPDPVFEYDWFATSRPARLMPLIGAGGVPLYDVPVDLYGILVASAAILDDYTSDLLVVSLTLEFVGDSSD